jgi:hypothetical protein
MMAPIHDRMPVMIPEAAWERWLDPARTEGAALGELKGLLIPSEDGSLEMYPVSRRVNDVHNDGPDLVEPIPAHEVASGPSRPTRDGRRRVAPPPEPGLFDDPDEAP